jgi:hypothetical protein
MTKRAVNGIEACGSSPGCVLLRTATWLPMGLIFDAPVFVFKGVVYGGYYGAKGFYYGARGLGKGVAYTGRSIGRGLAYPFNRPPKPIRPPTTWEQYKHDVLKHQKVLAKADKANKETQRWCVKNVPLEISPNRAKWESLCNAGDAVSRATLPRDVIAASIPPTIMNVVAAPTTDTSPSGTPAAIAPAVPTIPALQDPAKALGDNDPQTKTAGASGFDDSGPMAGKLASNPEAPSGAVIDAQPAPIPEVLLKPESTAVAAVAPPAVLPTDVKSTPPPSPTKTPPTAAAPPPATPSAPPAVPIPLTTPTPSVPAVVPAAPRPTTTAAAPASSSFVVPKFTEIVGGKEFKLRAARDLELISKTKTGQALLKSLEDSGQKLKIISDGGAGNETDSFPVTWDDAWKAKKSLPGVGSKTDVTIKYDPDRTNLLYLGAPYSDKDVTWAREPNRPSHVGLFHEMVHADDLMHGTMDVAIAINAGKRAGRPISAFEMRAVGLDGKKHAFDENSYRRELKLPERDFY